MPKIGAALTLFFLLGSIITTKAAELVVYTMPKCPACMAWKIEIGKNFSELPVIHSPARWDMVAPTFVVRENGVRIGTIVGYENKRSWWRQFREIMKRIKS